MLAKEIQFPQEFLNIKLQPRCYRIDAKCIGGSQLNSRDQTNGIVDHFFPAIPPRTFQNVTQDRIAKIFLNNNAERFIKIVKLSNRKAVIEEKGSHIEITLL